MSSSAGPARADRVDLGLSADAALVHLESSVDAMLTVGPAGTIRWANLAAARVFGYELDDFVGLALEDLIPKPFRRQHDEYHRDYMAKPKQRFMGASPRSLVGLRRDGSIFAAEISLGSIPDGDGTSVLAIVRDVAERRAREAEDDAIRVSMDTVGEAVFMLETGTFAICYANEAGCQLTGLRRQDLVDRKTFLDLSPRADRRMLDDILAPLLAGDREAITYDSVHLHSTEGERNVEVLIQRYGGVTFGKDCLIALVRDNTERLAQHRRIEESERLLRVLSNIRLALLAEHSLPEMLSFIAESALRVMDAKHAHVATMEPNGELEIGAVANSEPPEATVSPARAERVESLVMSSGVRLEVDLQVETDMAYGSGGPGGADSLGWIVASPLQANDGPRGVLVIGKQRGAPKFTAAELRLVDALSAESVLAVDFHRSRRQQDRLQLMEDRDRIGRELQDSAIQRLFAAGMRLQSAGSDGERLVEVSGEVIEEIDNCIALIRDTIFNVASRQ